MIANYIFKPDMIIDVEAINYFNKIVKEACYIKIKNIYEINDWTTLSKMLYEENNSNQTFRNKLLIGTIIAYRELYGNNAKIIEIDFDKSKIKLELLYEIKKIIRKKYAYSKPNYYINIKNIEEVDLNKKLYDIDINNINYDIIKSDIKLEDSNSIFAYLNYIHFSDPNIKSIQEDNKKILNYTIERNKR
ncbi:MAG: hypothetical protein RSB77_04960 [Bacilli bacterium]